MSAANVRLADYTPNWFQNSAPSSGFLYNGEVLKRIITGLLGVPLLLVSVYEAYLQSFGFYAEHWTMPIEKYGARTALRWQDVAFLVVVWPILIGLFYVSYRLLKSSFHREHAE